MLQAITRRLKRGKRGISTVIVVMLSLVLVVIIVGNVVLWSYQMNQLDMDRMQETLSFTNVTRVTSSPWFTAQTEFSASAGSRVSGTYTDTTALDSSFEMFREEKTQVFHPSSYSLGGSTSYV
jgi:Na+-transporting NADH:ubiquinone oxidoreductase subunit NqrC